eukprot:CAMPEP_0179144136 /NCGR_PEP_ID=MMETSP0796-20121207/69408_1 /TAXON_ID=73915 /ORGANISM="Pyrodinium bahamense, Strain pbaha01" /LENGTH=467 /DNA_ID=CAMNT_0020844305 /DNA_START=3 /DNA_END=1406 /DNA_ORIENTATION=-
MAAPHLRRQLRGATLCLTVLACAQGSRNSGQDSDLRQVHRHHTLSLANSVFARTAPERLQEQCPLFRDERNPGLLKHSGSPETRECCSNAALLYNCDALAFEIGDIVMWSSFDADIPRGSLGNVTKLDPPFAIARFRSGLYKFGVSQLRLVKDTTKDRHWFCHCDACRAIQEKVQFSKYLVEQQEKDGKVEHIRVWAEFQPKGAQKKFTANRRYVLFLYPMSDSNNAFAFREQLCERVACWQQRGYSVVFRVVASTVQARVILNQFDDRSIHHVILGGHGTATTLKWGDGTDGKLKLNGWANNVLLKLRAKLLLNATVILDSCSSAADVSWGRNVFTAVAHALPGRKIVGATVDLKESMWVQAPGTECLAGDSVIFAENGVTLMKVAEPGLPHCEEMTQNDIEHSLLQGGRCLSGCRSRCPSTLQVWRQSGVLGNLRVTLAYSGESQDEHRSVCFFGSQSVCQILPA